MKKIYLLATAVAIMTGFSVYIFASNLMAEAEPIIIKYETEFVVAAAADIPANTKLTPELLELVEIPKDAIASGVASEMDQLIGKTTKYPLIKGEQFYLYKAADIGDADNERLSDRIKSGYRAYTIYADEVTGLAGYLRIGDRVDIMVTAKVPAETGDEESPEEVTETFYFLTNIPIIAVGSASQYASGQTELNAYSSITLETKVEDCTMFEYYILNGTVKVVLRGFGDESEISDAAFPD